MFRVRREFIDRWVRANKPGGIGRLAELTEIPVESLKKIRTERPIQDPLKMKSLARALGVKESELFVPVSAGAKIRAS